MDDHHSWMQQGVDFLTYPNVAPNDGSPAPQEQGRAMQTGWTEPPLRPPQPSFMDHRGLERQGVLEGMYALGTKPSAKARHRARGDPLRRAAGVDGYLSADSTRGTPTRAASLRVDEQSGAASPSADGFVGALTASLQDGDTMMHDYVPQVMPSRMVAQEASNYAYPEPPIDPSLMGQFEQSQSLEQPQMQAEEQAINVNVPVDPMRMEKAIVNANNRRPDLHPMITHLHSAILRDHDFATLIAINASGNASRAQKKELKHKIGDLKRLVHVPDYTPRRIRTKSGLYSSGSTIASPEASRSNPTMNYRSLSHQPSDSHLQNLSSPRTTLKLHLNPSSTSIHGTSPLKNVSTAREGSVRMAPDAHNDDSSSALSSVDEEIAQEADPGPSVRTSHRTRNGKQASKKKTTVKRRRPETSEEFDTDEVVRDREETRKKFKQDFSSVLVEDSNMRSTYGRDFPDQLEQVANAGDTQPGLPSSALGNAVFGPTNLGRPPKPRASKAKVITSPSKSREAVTAGRPAMRTLNFRNDHPHPQTHSEISENNNDFCEACGGSGYLLCCDGCDRAFHLSCCDPPLDNATSLDAPYFCYHCENQNEDGNGANQGPFSSLLDHLLQMNPEAFVLPEHIRNYFEGNATGEDGRYLSVPVRGTNNTDLNLRQEKKYCYACNQSSWLPSDSSSVHANPAQRDIIPCDTCGLFWHLDCLSPPQAHAPVVRNGDSRTRFTCPHHTSQDIQAIDPISGAVSYGSGPSHHFRIPKKKTIITPVIPRGQRNYGNIEIMSDSDSDDDAAEEFEDADGTTYRLPAKAVKLDFIHQIRMRKQVEAEAAFRDSIEKRNKASYQQNLAANAALARERRASQMLGSRDFMDGHAALSLIELANGGATGKFSDDEITNLIYTLHAEATTEVAKKFQSQSRAPTLSVEQQREAITKLQAVLNERLLKLGGAIASDTAAVQQSTSAQASASKVDAPATNRVD